MHNGQHLVSFGSWNDISSSDSWTMESYNEQDIAKTYNIFGVLGRFLIQFLIVLNSVLNPHLLDWPILVLQHYSKWMSWNKHYRPRAVAINCKYMLPFFQTIVGFATLQVRGISGIKKVIFLFPKQCINNFKYSNINWSANNFTTDKEFMTNIKCYWDKLHCPYKWAIPS